jgi:exonuclease VII small subunit
MISNMLDKLVPPTDNLYKFIAISGLLLVILSFVPQYFLVKLIEQRIQLNKDLKVFVLEFKKFNEDYEKHVKEFENHNARLEDLNGKLKENIDLIQNATQNLKNRNLKKANNQYREFKENSNKIERLMGEIDIVDLKIKEKSQQMSDKHLAMLTKSAELDSTSELIDFYNERISYLQGWSLIIFVIGLVMTGFGFYKWYQKVQKLNDRTLEIQAKSVRKRRRMI